MLKNVLDMDFIGKKLRYQLHIVPEVKNLRTDAYERRDWPSYIIDAHTWVRLFLVGVQSFTIQSWRALSRDGNPIRNKPEK